MEDAVYPSGAFFSNQISKKEFHKPSVHSKIILFSEIITHSTKRCDSLGYVLSAFPFCFTWHIEGGKKSL